MPLTDVPERNDVDPTQPDVASPDQKAPSKPNLVVVIICAALALTVVFIACLKPGSSDAYLFRVMAGQVIHEKGIPQTDPFTWSNSGQPLFLDGWLGCLFFFQVNSHLPQIALVIYKGAVPLLITLLVLWRALGRSRSWPISVAAALLAGMVLADWAEVNQQMITYVIFAALLISLDKYRKGGAKLLPLALPFVFALWANLSSAAVIGLALLLIWAVAESCMQADTPFKHRPLIAGLIGSGLAIAANPYGFKVYSYEMQVLSNAALINGADPDSHSLRYFQILLIGTPIAMLFAGIRRGWSVGDALMLLAMAAAALLLKRDAAPFAIAAAPVFAGALSSGLDRSRLEFFDKSGVRILGVACAFAAFGVLIFLKIPRIDKGNLFKHTFKTGSFPIAGLKHLNTGKYAGVLYNDFDWGGYMTWKLWPARLAFTDPRPDFFIAPSAYKDSEMIESTGPGWQQALDRLGVQVVLTHKRGRLGKALLLDRRWKMVFYGPVEGIFTRVPAA